MREEKCPQHIPNSPQLRSLSTPCEFSSQGVQVQPKAASMGREKPWPERSVLLLCFVPNVGSVMDAESSQQPMWAARGLVHPLM